MHLGKYLVSVLLGKWSGKSISVENCLSDEFLQICKSDFQNIFNKLVVNYDPCY